MNHVINFKKQFVPLILSGGKTTTIRRERKRPIRPMDTLLLYVGLRTKAAERIAVSKCTEVIPISISRDSVKIYEASPPTLEQLAWADGFHSSAEFIRFFERQYRLPFDGVIIRWAWPPMGDGHAD